MNKKMEVSLAYNFSCLARLHVKSCFLGKMLLVFALIVVSTLPNKGFAAEAKGFSEALSMGKVSLNLRYRYEWVDQANLSKKAHASTLRTRLGYQTLPFKGFIAFLEMEDISLVGREQYNNTGNGKTQYPVVADPEDTELNQAYLKYTGLRGLVVTGGRQRIKLDNDRFIGNVGWRQNEQTFDALRLAFSPMEGMTGTYIYLENANLIWGEHHPTASKANTQMESHVIHFTSTRVSALNVSAYAYLLDFDDKPTASNKTFGVRFKGIVPVGALKFLYTAEYADQSDYADGDPVGTDAVDADYSLLEVGASTKGVTLKFSREVLSGNGTGGYAFQTPFATAHAFQGWADKFLTTPVSGVEDLFATLSVKVMGAKLVAIYHVFRSDSSNFDYGTELDLLAVKKLSKHYLVLVKYARYDGDKNAQNIGAGPVPNLTSVDTDKLWLMAQMSF